ncbi:MAG: hypothetical protein ACLR1A_07710 [Eubacterium ventriosum]
MNADVFKRSSEMGRFLKEWSSSSEKVTPMVPLGGAGTEYMLFL